MEPEMTKQYLPKRLLMQWHVTERCMLKCRHCYQDSAPQSELPFETLLEILGQYKSMLGEIYGRYGHGFGRGWINVTGGEPFVRDDFLDLIDMFTLDRELYSFAILSNGVMIDRKIARYLRCAGAAFVQVSIDGREQTHDSIRRQGSFAKAVAGIRCLVAEKVPVMISFTAHRENYREFPAVAKLGRKLGVFKVWSDRFVPCAADEGLQTLGPEETREYVRMINGESRSVLKNLFSRTRVTSDRALQSLDGCGSGYSCGAGNALVTVMSDGGVVPCRRMPVVCGRLPEESLIDIYHGNEVFAKLRDRGVLPEKCRACVHSEKCRGGAKCISFAVHGDPFKGDPGCWIA